MYTRGYLLWYDESIKEIYYSQWRKKQNKQKFHFRLSGLALDIFFAVNYYISIVNYIANIFKTNCIFAV